MKALYIGDLHLDALNWNVSMLLLQVATIKSVLEYARQHQITNIIFLGDIGHYPLLSVRSHIYLLDLLTEYSDLVFDFILGNHDFKMTGEHSLLLLEYLTKLGNFSHVSIHSVPKVKKIEGSRINFSPYPHVEETKYLNIGHFEVCGSKRDNGLIIKEGIELKRDWVMGHLHTKQKVKRTQYPGTLYQVSFGEQYNKGFAVIDYNSGEVEYEWVKIKPSFELRNVVLTEEKDLALLKEDNNVFFKVWLNTNEIDSNALLSPNIVKILAGSKRKDVEINGEETELSTFDADSWDIKDVLGQILSTSNYPKPFVKEIHGLLDKIISKGG